MQIKTLPFSPSKLNEILRSHQTPFHIYDEKAIKSNANNFLNAFSWNEGFKEYYAVKANPNPYILKILHSLGFGTDCSSLPELVLSEKCGIIGEETMFSSNDTPIEEFKKAKELNAIINLDDISHISFLEKHCGLPDTLSFRYNPGSLREGNFIIGNPIESKYGFTREQIFGGFKIIREKGVKKYGIHTFVASNELNPNYFIDTANMMFDLAVDLKNKIDIQVDFINLSGGIGIPYELESKPVDITFVGQGIKKAYDLKIKTNGLHPVKIFMECGRFVTGPYGYLISKVIHKKNIYKTYIGLDACMAHLMRPALYKAYHHITVVNKQDKQPNKVYDVTGSLCENNDKFAIDRKLPEIEIGDILAIHDTGAHGHAMGFNYNGKLKSSELLLQENGNVIEIRRAETINDYLATLDFNKLNNCKI